MNDSLSYKVWKWIYKYHFENFTMSLLGLCLLEKYFLVNNHKYSTSSGFYDENIKYDDLDYPGGFIEKDFQHVLANENPKVFNIKNKIVLYLMKNVNLHKTKEVFGDEMFNKVIEDCLIHGDYEKYGMNFEKVISVVIDKKLLDKSSLWDVSIMRGVVLGSREKNEVRNFWYELRKKIFSKFLF